MRKISKNSLEENERITAPITEKEVHNFISSLNPNKAPGISGLRKGLIVPKVFVRLWRWLGEIYNNETFRK